MHQKDMKLSSFQNKRDSKTPEFRCRLGDGDYFFVECKRLQKGPYVKQEILQHHIRSHLAELHIKSKKMNVWTDVTYLCEVKDAPENYIISHLKTLKAYFMNGMMIMEKERLDWPT